MRKIVIISIITILWIISVGAGIHTCAEGPGPYADVSEFQTMYTTAYCLHGITAIGGTTRPGICACNPHVGDIAMVYTMDGEFITMLECTDTGTTNGLQSGTVLDVWFDTYEECQEWMVRTSNDANKVKVLWIHGVG